MTAAATNSKLTALPADFDRVEIEQFLFQEARYADESDYDAWEALWTDDALYWVPANGADTNPRGQMSIIYDNRSRIRTRLTQARTGRRYAAVPVSSMRRSLSNIEFLGGRASADGTVDVEVAANFLLLESRARGNHLWGGRVTYRVRRTDEGLRLAYKKVELIDNDKPIPTLGFLI
jgi:benzoate/toluate 1,2-dioxygenase subunit beta